MLFLFHHPSSQTPLNSTHGLLTPSSESLLGPLQLGKYSYWAYSWIPAHLHLLLQESPFLLQKLNFYTPGPPPSFTPICLAQWGLRSQQYPLTRLTRDQPRRGLERKPQLLENWAQMSGSSLKPELSRKEEADVIVWWGGTMWAGAGLSHWHPKWRPVITCTGGLVLNSEPSPPHLKGVLS